MRIVLEAGTHSDWVSRLLERLGHEVPVPNPRRVRAIYQNKDMSDRADAEQLARIGRVDRKLLYPIRHRSQAVQQDLIKLRARQQLVGVRTQRINSVRSMVKVVGGRLPKGSAESFPRKVTAYIPQSLRATLMPLLVSIEDISEQIRSLDREVQRLCEEKYPETKVLQQIRGVGPLTALAYVLTLENPDRFRKNRSVGAYLGLTPKRDQSGGKRDRQLPISKQGDRLMRQLLVTSATGKMPVEHDSQDGCPTGCNFGGRTGIPACSVPTGIPACSVPTGIPACGSSPTLSTGKMPVERDSQDGCPTAPAVTSAVEQASLPVGPSGQVVRHRPRSRLSDR